MSDAEPCIPSDVTAAILAGGLGTRLRSAIDDRPKVLAPVEGRPFLCYLLDALNAAAVRRVVLLTGYRGEQIRQAVGERYGAATLVYSDESSPLGTGGALRQAVPLLDTQTILLLNGDSYFHVDIAALLRFNWRRRADVTLSLAWVDDASRFGRVDTTPDGRVTAFVEKQAAACPGWINAGVYVLDRRLVEDISADGPISLERDLLPIWTQRNTVFCRRAPGPFLDVGTPDSYASAAAFFKQIAAARPPMECVGVHG